MKIVIVGASSGIGYEVAELFIKSGWKTTICARRVEKLEPLVKINPENVKAYSLDICSSECEFQLEKILSEDIKTNIYFHVAGIGNHNQALDSKIELATIATNCEGFVRCIDTAFNYFRKNGGGHIAAISSIAGTKGLGAAPAYSASKKMQSTYLQSLSQLSSLISTKITITDIRPGFVKTDLLDSKRNYPLLMDKKYVAKKIYKSIIHKKRIKIIDWKYAILVYFWRMIPRFIWERLKIDAK
ncbi:MAG: SDR family NAD(P)-dependent oxidoreductase [Bacteroidales bacterium]|nr:SDR family NAD(P)-dependent oxidoreductase [Bacteroidales bacterium]